MANELDFKAGDKSLKEVLFHHIHRFRIPRYQRAYAWEEDQITEFWNDLITIDESYFIGSFIFNREFEDKTGYIDVIDGHQRLLTVTIFCAILRDVAKSLDKDTSDWFHRHDIVSEGREKGSVAYRIMPGDSTKDFFENNIQNKDNNILESQPKTKEEMRIKRNYEFLHEKLIDELKKFENNEQKLKYLEKLRNKISDLIVIDIRIKNEEAAYEIFETTNARGIDLSVSDLLKNSIFKKIPIKEEKDIAKAIWKDITDNVEGTNTELKKFIRYFWLSKHSFVTEKKLFRRIKKEITDWEGLLNDLCYSSEWFNKLLAGYEGDFQEFKNGYKIYKSIFSIGLMNVTQCYVLLLCLMRNFDKLKTDPTKIFQLIEKFTFKYSVVCKLPGNKVEKIYSKYALKIEKAIKENPENKISVVVQNIFSELRKELEKEKPIPEVFKESFVELSYKNSEKSRKLIKYILNEVDNYYRETGEEKIDFNNVNIEHILPQKPDKKWNLTREEIKSYVNMIGNLTLVDKRINSKVQSKIIKEKIDDLSKSRLPIMRLLIKDLKDNKYKWDEEEIIKRQERLADLACDKIWNF